MQRIEVRKADYVNQSYVNRSINEELYDWLEKNYSFRRSVDTLKTIIKNGEEYFEILKAD